VIIVCDNCVETFDKIVIVLHIVFRDTIGLNRPIYSEKGEDDA